MGFVALPPALSMYQLLQGWTASPAYTTQYSNTARAQLLVDSLAPLVVPVRAHTTLISFGHRAGIQVGFIHSF